MKVDKVKIGFVETNSLIRWPCHVCGGYTEKIPILAEATEGESNGLRVCEICLEERDFDEKLLKHAQELEHEAGLLRSLIGRLEVPTFEEYKDRTRRCEEK